MTKPLTPEQFQEQLSSLIYKWSGMYLRTHTHTHTPAQTPTHTHRLVIAGKRESEIPLKWEEEYGRKIDYIGQGFPNLHECLKKFKFVRFTTIGEGRDQHFRVHYTGNPR